jgi:hypothetical protein
LADIGQVVATGATTIVGIAVGAGLTYRLNVLSRRHQEAREDRARWYEQRFRAYVDFSRAENELFWAIHNNETTRSFRREEVRKLHGLLSVIDFVESPEVRKEAGKVFDATLDEIEKDKPFEGGLHDLDALIAACRKDLGHP